MSIIYKIKIHLCKQVSYSDIADAVENMDRFGDVPSAFEDVQKVTHCSTGCGVCNQKVLDIISDMINGSEK